MSEITTRRAVLGRIAGAVALTLPVTALAAVPVEPDAEIIALSAVIVRRAAEADEIQATRIDPFEDRYHELVSDETKPPDVCWEEACAFSRECGREDAVEHLEVFDEGTTEIFYRLMAIPATTQPGRAAKVRALIVHVMRSRWRGPASELDWDKEMARTLLGEFAGLSAAELDRI